MSFMTADDLRARREAVVRLHMEAENVHDYDAVIGTFAHPRYELMATGQVFDGEAEVWCCGKVKYLDLGGGKRKTWRELLRSRDDNYKWQYVPRQVKENPEAAPEWRVHHCECGWRTLGANSCSRCAPGR
jgi:hypothetical protein